MARKQTSIKTDIIIEERILSFLREYDTERFVRKVKLDDDLAALEIK